MRALARETSSWIQLRLNLLRHTKDRVREILGPEDPELQKYARYYQAEFETKWQATRLEDLVQRVERANLILGGDFHAFPQSQRAHLRLLRELPEDKSVVLLLECFCSDDQTHVDEWMSGGIDDETLLRRVDWVRKWGFPWQGYSPLMELAKRRRWKVAGVNLFRAVRSGRGLKVRDQHAANVIGAWCEQEPFAIKYVIFGDLHLAQRHLPNEIRKNLRRRGLRTQLLTIFQSSEKLYFALAKRKRELSTQVMKSSGNRFCLMTTPPWVKWQWYLMYLEGHIGNEASGVDAEELISEMVMHLVREVGLDLSSEDLFSGVTVAIKVTDAGDPTLPAKVRQSLGTRDASLALKIMAAGHSFFEPKSGFCFVSSLTLNHYAELAGQVLQAHLSQRNDPLLRSSKSFLPRVWVEALGFFCSKLLNDRRKPKPLPSSEINLKRGPSAKVLQIALREGFRVFATSSGHRARLSAVHGTEVQYFEAARILGGHLGERLYVAYRTGLVDRDDIVEFMGRDATHPSFEEFYLLVLRMLGPVVREMPTKVVQSVMRGSAE